MELKKYDTSTRWTIGFLFEYNLLFQLVEDDIRHD